MARGQIITLQPKCLQWARERARMSVTALADKLGVAEGKVAAWEQSGEITLSHAEKLAGVTRIPLGYLYLSEPPVERLPIKDFRTVDTQDISTPSPDLLEVINDAILRQDWYREYARSTGRDPLLFVKSIKVSSDIVGIARLGRSN